MRKNALAVLVCAMLVFVACQSLASDAESVIYVLPDEDLQKAIDEAPEGATLVLQSGESYEGPIRIYRDLTLRVDNEPDALGDIIQISLAGSTPNYILFGVAEIIQTGSAHINGAVYVHGGTVNLENLDIVAPRDVIGVMVEAGSLRMSRCVVTYSQIGIQVLKGVQAEIADSAVSLCKGAGILVHEGANLTVSNSFIARNKGNGIEILGNATVSRTFIEGNGYFHESERESTEGKGLGNGIAIWHGGELRLDDSWVVRNAGSGLSFRALEYLDARTPNVYGGGNVIPDRDEADGNSAGTFEPHPLELSKDQELQCCSTTLLARIFPRITHFRWDYYGKTYDLSFELLIPAGGVLCTWDGSRTDAEPQDAQTAYAHFTNTTTLKALVDRLVEIAHEEGYYGYCLADFIVQFAASSADYDHERSDNDNEHGYLIPVVTLAKREGVCRDQAILASVLLELAGFDCVLLLLEPINADLQGHMIIGADIEGAWGQYVEHEGARYYLTEATSERPLIGDYSLEEQEYTISEIINPSWSAELVAEMSFFDLETVKATGEMGELRVWNRGSLGSLESTIDICDLFHCAEVAIPSLTLKNLLPGEEEVFVLQASPFLSSEMLDDWNSETSVPPLIMVTIEPDYECSIFGFYPGDHQQECP